MLTGGGLTLGDEYRIHYTDEVLQNCEPQTDIILLTNVTANKCNKFF